MDVMKFVEFKNKIISNISRVIVGKEDIIELVIVSFICGGHVLIEDAPGMGKTKLAKAFAKTLGLDFKRIQFTPDLLPSDITGVNIYNQKTSEFEFRPGPIMTQFLLADELNRATPRTQSALLEAMEEGQITADGITYALPRPFFCMATQNPVETYGTFPLPEAQLDRFFMKLSVGYPNEDEECEILRRFDGKDPLDAIDSVVSSDEIDFVRQAYSEVTVEEDVAKYIIAIVNETRVSKDIELGVSPRGSLALYRAGQAYAAVSGRDYVTPDDIKHVAMPVLNHRLILKADARYLDNRKSLVSEILDRVPVPTEHVETEK